MIRKGNVTIGLQTRFGPGWTGIRCGARTKLGGECQRPAVKKNRKEQIYFDRSPKALCLHYGAFFTTAYAGFLSSKLG